MPVDTIVLLVAIPAVFFAGMSKGGFGSGAAFAASPILALVVEPSVALGLMLPLLMLMDVVSLRAFWGQWHRPSAQALIIGSIPGVGLGALFYAVVNADILRLLIGAIALLFVAYQISRARGWLKIPNRPFDYTTGITAGFAAGFTSFVSHAGGPPAAAFMLAQGMEKLRYQATSVAVFWVINLLKVVPFAALGLFTRETLILDLWLIPVAILGALTGIWAHRKVPERLFFAITYVFLVITGAKLIWDGLT